MRAMTKLPRTSSTYGRWVEEEEEASNTGGSEQHTDQIFNLSELLDTFDTSESKSRFLLPISIYSVEYEILKRTGVENLPIQLCIAADAHFRGIPLNPGAFPTMCVENTLRQVHTTTWPGF